MMAFALISTIFLGACSSTKYNSNGIGCYVSNDKSNEVRTALTDSCQTSSFEPVYTAQ